MKGETMLRTSKAQAVNNLAYTSTRAKEFAREVLADPAVRHFTKEIIRDGLHKDFIGAVRDVELALEVLERVGEGIQDKISATPRYENLCIIRASSLIAGFLRQREDDQLTK